MEFLGLEILGGGGRRLAKGEDRVVELVMDMYLGLRFVPQSISELCFLSSDISSLLFHHWLF